MKFIKKITLIALSLLVFCCTTFAISTSNNINRDISIIGKAKQVILADLKTDMTKPQMLTPAALLVVVGIVLISTCPAYTSTGNPKPKPKPGKATRNNNFNYSNIEPSKIAISNLD